MTELAQMGFDEIVLDYFGYPTQADGTLGNLGQSEDNYPAGALDGVITGFLAQAAQALEPYGTKLSLHASAGVLTGADGSAGLTPAALNASVDRVWVSGTRSDVLRGRRPGGVERVSRCPQIFYQHSFFHRGGSDGPPRFFILEGRPLPILDCFFPKNPLK